MAIVRTTHIYILEAQRDRGDDLVQDQCMPTSCIPPLQPVALEGDEPGRRGVGAIWRRIERDIEEQ